MTVTEQQTGLYQRLLAERDSVFDLLDILFQECPPLVKRPEVWEIT